MYVKRDLSMVLRDSFAFDVELIGLEGVTIKDLRFTIKKKDRDPDEEALVMKSFDNGVHMVSAGTYRVRVAPEDTEDVAPGRYVHDLELTVGQDVYTLMKGKMRIHQDVTHERSENA